jgi:hypothetical protein
VTTPSGPETTEVLLSPWSSAVVGGSPLQQAGCADVTALRQVETKVSGKAANAHARRNQLVRVEWMEERSIAPCLAWEAEIGRGAFSKQRTRAEVEKT